MARFGPSLSGSSCERGITSVWIMNHRRTYWRGGVSPGRCHRGIATAQHDKAGPACEAVRAREDLRPLEGRDRVPAIRGSRSRTCSTTERRNTSSDLARFSGARGRAPSPNCTRVAGWSCFQGASSDTPNRGLKTWPESSRHFGLTARRPLF